MKTKEMGRLYTTSTTSQGLWIRHFESVMILHSDLPLNMVLLLTPPDNVRDGYRLIAAGGGVALSGVGLWYVRGARPSVSYELVCWVRLQYGG